MKALLIDENRLVSGAMEQYLKKESIPCVQAHSGKEGLDILSSKGQEPDLIIMNSPTTDIDLDEFLLALHNDKISLPVLLIVDRSEVNDTLLSMLRDQDDYLVRPFNSKELAHRARKLNVNGFQEQPTVKSIGPIFIDFNNHTTMVDGNPLDLTTKEQQIVEIMACNQGKPVSKKMFLQNMYQGSVPAKRVIDVFVCKVRAKVDKYADSNAYIHTVWGRGYSIDDNGEE